MEWTSPLDQRHAESTRRDVRSELGVPPDEVLVLTVANSPTAKGI